METMKDNESIRILNTIQYSDYTGYGWDKTNEKTKSIIPGFRFQPSTENFKLHRTNIVAIDALDYRGISKDGQYSRNSVRREIIKCLAGLRGVPPSQEPTTSLGKGKVDSPRPKTTAPPQKVVAPLQEPTTPLGKGIASTPSSRVTTTPVKSIDSSPSPKTTNTISKSKVGTPPQEPTTPQEPTIYAEASSPPPESTNTNTIFSKLNVPLVLGTIAGVVVAASFAGGGKSKKRRKIGKNKIKTKKI
jgi:hypothetical protein